MRLYLTAGGVYVGTQNDARKEGKGWREEIVPTDKSGLIEYLNTLAYKGSPTPMLETAVASGLTTPEKIEAQTAEVEAKWDRGLKQPTVEAIAAKVSQFKTNEIVEFILDHASVMQVETILASIGTRVGELAKGTRK